MSAIIIQPTESPFDPKAHREARNAAEESRRNPAQVKPEPVKVETAPEPEPVKVKPEPEDKNGHLPRSARRELNRLREELGELRGQLKAYKEIAPTSKQAEPVQSDAKPKREDFRTDAEFAGEMGAWSARQEIGKSTAQTAEMQRVQAKLDAAAAAKATQIEALGDDWDKYQEEGEELKIDSDAERMLFATSRYAVFVGAYFVDHPKAWEEFKELGDDPLEQRDYFKHIEGEAKIEYSKAKAAQAKEPKKEPEDRNHPAEAQAGRTAAGTESVTRLPRPSSEAAARGGTAVPNEPPVGSAAWIRARNAAKAPSRF